jgi:copper chaperone CopZ
VTDVHIYVNKPLKDVPNLEDLEVILKELGCVSEARAEPPENVIAVSFEGGGDEQEEIEHAIEETGYRISRLSVRTDFPGK